MKCSEKKREACRLNGLKGGRAITDLTGRKFDLLTVVSLHLKTRPSPIWNCVCDCGEHAFRTSSVLKKSTRHSCGCLKRKPFTHGHATGGRVSSEYRSWTAMIARCTNPNNNRYRIYGARGISVCERWLCSFSNFISDMGRKPFPGASLERINNNGNYEPSNCRWATRTEQMRNKRTTVMLTYLGVTKPLAQWAEERKVAYGTLRNRIRKGWDVEKSLNTPPQSSGASPSFLNW